MLNIRITAVGLSVICMASCNKIEVKQDTPQAAVATLVKIYKNEKWELLPKIVEPAIAKRELRDSKCLAASLKYVQCVDEMEDCVRRNFVGCRHTEGCPVDVESCRCGASTTQARYLDSTIHKALRLKKLDPERCSIGKAIPVERKDVFGSESTAKTILCDDLSGDYPLAEVTLDCRGDEPMRFVLRNRGGWTVYAFDDKTWQNLQATGAFGKTPEEIASQEAQEK